MTTKAAVTNFFMWVAISMVVNVVIYFTHGGQLAAEFFGAWSLEKALSLDNLFMFYFIFSSFRTPHAVRPRALRWGIVGVIVMRGAIIIGGMALIAEYRWVLWFFAAFLVWAAFKIFFLEDGGDETEEEKQAALEKNWLVRLVGKILPFDKRYHSDHFFVKIDGKWKGTMLLLVVVVVEGTDVPFAFDSLPAAFAVSQTWWIVASSNLLAVMGLRAIYFLIENMRERFSHMQQGIGLLLAFAAFKIIGHDLGQIVNSAVGWAWPGVSEYVAPTFHISVPLWLSLTIILGIIVLTISYTLLRTRGMKPETDDIE